MSKRSAVTHKFKEGDSHPRQSDKNNAITDSLFLGSVAASQPIDSLSTPVQKHAKRLQTNIFTQNNDVSECTFASLIKNIDLETTHKRDTEPIVTSTCEIDSLETNLLAGDLIASVDRETNSVTSTVKVSGEFSPTKFEVTVQKMTSNESLTLRPMLERLSPEKCISKTTSPEKAGSNNQVSRINAVTVELEKLKDKELQDKAATPTTSAVVNILKRKSEDVESSSKRSQKTKSTVVSERKKQKKLSTTATKSASSDFSRHSPHNKGLHRHELRKRKPVFYAEENIIFDPTPKPTVKMPKVTKERRFQHICLKERKDIHEIVIAVEAANQKYVDSSVSRKYNFLFEKTLNELITAFQISRQDKQCKAVILSSVGPVFCSGLDPASLLNWSQEQPVIQDIIELMKYFVNMLIRYSKPIVAIVQGPAVGFGATLLLHCDSVYASDRASLQWPFAQIGLSPFGCTTEILNQTVGLCRTRSLLLEGRIISAQMAKDLGIITEVFPHDSLLANAWPLCSALGHCSEFALLETKLLVNINLVKSLVDCNICETIHLKQCLKNPSCLDYLQSYVIQHLRIK